MQHDTKDRQRQADRPHLAALPQGSIAHVGAENRKEKMKKKPLPAWLILIIVIETLPMFIGPLLALLRPDSFPGLDQLPDPGFAAWLYSARNFAVGIAFLVAFALKNRSMLFILILIRLITDLYDLPNLLSGGALSSPLLVIAIFVLLYYLPAIIALRYLWKEINKEQQSSNG
jgi:hypothetical protein